MILTRIICLRGLVQNWSNSIRAHLGEQGSGADTYLGMVRTNVERIVGALK